MIEDTSRKLYCANHPNRETLLRCNRCERPICVDCAILTETGYRCKDCVRGQQKIFETAQWLDYPLGIAVAGVLAFIGSILAGFLGFFTLFIAPVAGVIIAEAVRWITKKRRSRWLYRATSPRGGGWGAGFTIGKCAQLFTRHGRHGHLVAYLAGGLCYSDCQHDLLSPFRNSYSLMIVC
jgi:hypothetical protein